MKAAETTVTIVRAALSADQGVPDEVRESVLLLLKGRKAAGLAPAAVARMFGVSVKTLWRRLKSGALNVPVVRVNARVIRLDAAAVGRELNRTGAR